MLSLVLLMTAGSSRAEVNVSVGINVPVPPPLFIPAPPELVIIPGTYAYYPPGVDVDIVFYHGYWYRPYDNYWYRATSYNGPWHYVVRERVPQYIFNLPPDYRRVYHDNPRIPYGHVHKNWNKWERDKYWDKRHWKHEQHEWKHEKKEQKHERKKVTQEHRHGNKEMHQGKQGQKQEHKQKRKNGQNDPE